MFFAVCADGKCAAPGSPNEAYKDAAAVFVGQVISIKERLVEIKSLGHATKVRHHTVTFSIEQAFKGVSGATVEIETNEAFSESFYNFKQGEQYLVYAYDIDAKFSVSICTRTTLLKNAEDEVECLRALSGEKTQGRIYGQVVRLTRDFAQGFGSTSAGAMAGVKVIVEGHGNRVEFTTDAEGNYRANRLEPGNYKVQAVLPEHYKGGEPRRLEVKARECVEAFFNARSEGSLKGAVLDARSRPVEGVAVSIMLADTAGSSKPQSMWDHTDENGRYGFEDVPAGRYLIGVNIAFAPDADAPYPPTYFPNVQDLSQATVIDLEEGQPLDNYNISLPAELLARTIRGRVLFETGQPVINGIITLRDLEYPEEEVAGKAGTDAQGRFVLAGFKNRRYKVYAYTAADGVNEQVGAEPVEIPAGTAPIAIQMTVKSAKPARRTSSSSR